MLEKFSFHGVRFTLVLYLSKQIEATNVMACTIYGSLMVMSFFIPICISHIFKHVSDKKVLSLCAALLLSIGPLMIGSESQILLYSGLSMMIMGGGIFRFVIPLYVGELYINSKKSKHSGFTLLYVFINAGSLAASLACGYIGEKINWYMGFAVASFAALLSLFVVMTLPSTSKYRGDKVKIYLAISIFILAFYAVSMAVFYHFELLNTIVVLSALYAVYWLCFHFKKRVETPLFIKFIFLMILQILFFSFYEQVPSTFVLFIEKYIDRSFGNIDVPVTFFQSLDPLINLVMGGFLSYLWTKLRGLQNAELKKHAFGFMMVFAAFLLMTYFTNIIQETNANLPAVFMILVFTCLVLGELLIVPIGMSYASTLSHKLDGSVIGVWSLAIGIGQWFSMLIGRRIGNNTFSDRELLDVFYHSYELCAFISLIIATSIIVFVSVRYTVMNKIHNRYSKIEY